MTEWPADEQRYELLRRKGTKGFSAADVGPEGEWTMLRALYRRLPPLADLGSSDRDAYTDMMRYGGYKLAGPLTPGRGHGIGDVPLLKVIGDVDPADITQGSVGDCWLLSGLASLAEYDGAIARLFRKTPELGLMPRDQPNQYIVTLYDMATWTEVDVTVDERLARRPDGTGLLGCDLSKDGELWAPYLEKAIAAHCGGWDKIDGGQCTHAWALLTGCREQFTIRQVGDGKYGCYGTYNPNTSQWEPLANSPHDGFQGLWPMEWPAVGGGGARHLEISADELFERMCAWDDDNFLVGAGTKAGSDKEETDGIVDGHAYSVLEVVNDAAGTPIDLIKLRNPWGSGEMAKGKWDDDGPGWAEYPQIKQLLRPEVADDGIFWVSKEEFFKYFRTIYVCAHNMAAFVAEAESQSTTG